MSVRDLTRNFFKGFAPPVRLPVDQWADAHRMLPKIANRRGGRWRTRCFQREIMRDFTNADVRSVCVVGAAQSLGKSELILNFIGRQIHLNPGPMMAVEPTDGLAKRFSRKRLQTMLDDTAPLTGLVSPALSRGGKNTITAKEFPGGEIRVVGADTPTALCSDPTRDVLIDEVDRCQKSCGREGDVVTLAEARQEDFGPDAFSLYVSSPSGSKPRTDSETQPEDVSKILMLFAETDQRYWFCPCQKCGRHQTLKFSQLIWPDKRPDQAAYVCEFGECLHPHTDAERVAMVEQGEWRATAPFNGRRGYFLNALCSLSAPQKAFRGKMHQLADGFLRAKRRGPDALRAWFNTQMCECFTEEAAETVPPLPLFSRREKFGDKLNPLICIITAGVDIHPNRIEAQIVGWGDGEESWSLEYAVFRGDTGRPGLTSEQAASQGPWKELDNFLLRQFEHPCGAILTVDRAAIDTGHRTDETYAFVKLRQMRGVYAVRNMSANGGGRGKPLMNPPFKSGVSKVRLWMVSKHTALRTVLSRLKIAEPSENPDGSPKSTPGYIHFRSDREPDFGLDYFKQLCANEVRTIKRAGEEWEEFDAGDRRDEAMDTYISALAALKARLVNFDRLKANMLASIPEPETARATKQPAQRPTQNFATAGMAWKNFR